MKKKRLLIVMSIMLVLLLAVGLTACGEESTPKPAKLTGVTVNGSSEYYIEDFNLSKLKLNLIYDNNDIKVINITESMLNEKDLKSLKYLGAVDENGKAKKEITVKYMGFTAKYSFNMTNNSALKQFSDDIVIDSEGFTVDGGKYYVDYDGEMHSLKLLNVPEDASINAKVSYSEKNLINAGTYEIIAQVKGKGYQTKEIIASLVIKPKKVKVPTVNGNLIFDERLQQAPILESEDYTIIDGKEAVNADTYKAILQLNDKNLAWEDGTKEGNTENVELEWTILPQLIIFEGSNAIKWDYNENGYLFRGAQTYRVQIKPNPLVSKGIVRPVYTNNVVTITDEQIASGEFNEGKEFTATVDFEIVNTNYVIDESKVHTSSKVWKIYRNRIIGDIHFTSIGKEIYDADGNFSHYQLEYSGQAQYPTIALSNNISGADISYLNSGNANATPEGKKYTVTAKISKKGYEDYKASVDYVIVPKVIDLPKIENQSMVFNGKEQIVKYNVDSTVLVDGNTFGIEPNSYYLTFKLENGKNYVWADDTTTEKVLNWQIIKITLPDEPFNWIYSDARYSDDNMPIYDEKNYYVLLDIDDALGLEVTYENFEQMNAGKFTKQNGKAAKATISLKYDEWLYNNLDNFKKHLVYEKEWEVRPKEIDFSTVEWSSDKLVYLEDPHAKQYRVSLMGLPSSVYNNGVLNENILWYTGNVVDASEGYDKIVTTHTAEYHLNPNYTESIKSVKKVHVWEIIENTIGNVIYEGKEVVFRGVGYSPIIPIVVGETVEDSSFADFYVDGILIKKGLKLLDKGTYAEIENFKLTNAKNYKLKVVIYKPHCTSITKEVDFLIKPQTVKVPQITNTKLTYNGELQSCGLVASDKYDIIGERTATNAGKYNVTVRLKANDNYVWEDNSQAQNGEISYFWEIEKLDFVPTIDNVKWQSNLAIEYNRLAQDIALEGLPKGIMVEYTTKKVDAEGNEHNIDAAINTDKYITYAVLKCKDKASFVNAEAIENFNIKAQKWEIVPKHIDASGIKWGINMNNGNKPLVYDVINGKEVVHSVTLINIPTEIDGMFSYENDIASKPGDYIAYAYFNDNEDNYVLDNLNIETKDSRKYISYRWSIVENYLNDWFYYDENPAGNYVFEYDGSAHEPELKIINKSVEEVETIKSNNGNGKIDYGVEIVSKVGTTSSTANTVGEYTFKTHIYYEGYAHHEQYITIKIVPKKIAKPMIDQVKLDALKQTWGDKYKLTQETIGEGASQQTIDVHELTYDKCEYIIPIKEDANSKYYVIRGNVMTSVNKNNSYYTITAEIIDDNYIWEDGNAMNYELPFKWRIVEPTAPSPTPSSAMLQNAVPEAIVSNKQ